MAAELSSVFSMGPKRVSLEEVHAIHQRMLNLVDLDKELETEMMKLAPDPASWEQLWQSRYNDLIERLKRNDLDLIEEEEEEQASEEEFTSDEDLDNLVQGEGDSIKRPRSLRAAMQKQLSLLDKDKEKKFRSSRIDYFEKFLDVETKRNEILTQKAAMCVQIKDLLEAEVNSEEVLDPEQEPIRRATISDMARWWDCLLYNTSVELNQRVQEDEVGKWSELYLKWCLWTDTKAGVFHDEIDDDNEAQTN